MVRREKSVCTLINTDRNVCMCHIMSWARPKNKVKKMLYGGLHI